MVTVVFSHIWNERQDRADARNGRELALGFIREGYLTIEMDSQKAWRPTFERLLNERYGLKFFPRLAYCRSTDISPTVENAFTNAMREEVAKRFAPGVLEQVAEEARKIYQAEQVGDGDAEETF